MLGFSKPTAANSEHFAQLFLGLWQMEEAGIASVEAVRILSEQPNCFQAQLKQLCLLLNAGNPVASSGFKVGLFNQTQKTLIHAGESSGRLSMVYKQLADFYSEKSSRERKIKSKLYLPFLVLAAALFISPLPDLIASRISGFEYLQLSAGSLFLIVVLAVLLTRLPFWLTAGFLRSFQSAYYQFQLQIPILRDWVIKREVCDFLYMLGMMLTAGLPFSEVLPHAVENIKNSILKKRFRPALAIINQGDSVTAVLSKAGLFEATTLQIMSTGEQSGKLADSILHIAELEAETISLQNEMLADWLPRLVYMVIALWMSYSIINSWRGILVASSQM